MTSHFVVHVHVQLVGFCGKKCKQTLIFILMHWKQTVIVQEFISELKIFYDSYVHVYVLKLRDFDNFTTWVMLAYVTFQGCKKKHQSWVGCCQ